MKFMVPGLRAKLLLLYVSLPVSMLVVGLLALYQATTLQGSLSSLKRLQRIADRALELQRSFVELEGLSEEYALTRDPVIPERIRQQRRNLELLLQEELSEVGAEDSLQLLRQLDHEYVRYGFALERRLYLSEATRAELEPPLRAEQQQHFRELLALCATYRRDRQQRLTPLELETADAVRGLALLAWVGLGCALLPGTLFGLYAFRRVLRPLRRMAQRLGSDAAARRDELALLEERLETLLESVDTVQLKLDQSREHLVQAEKMAMVGQMAAGVAHSIRNPLTSVKMRLFTLERSLALDALQKEDFEVIAEEIRHIDAILRNFLEFSRPPKLRTQPASPSTVVDMTLQLLRHRFETARVEVSLERSEPLPEAYCDPAQLKEVFMNLLINSCEAMAAGGRIRIREETGILEPWGQVDIVRISDDGPGIPAAVKDKVFEPFFSTKEDGTGLGLAIARRIMEEHGGWIHLQSEEGRGTTFVLGLPCREQSFWLRS